MSMKYHYVNPGGKNWTEAVRFEIKRNALIVQYIL